MVHNPFSFDKRLSGGTSEPSDQHRYIAPPFDDRMIGEQEVMLLISREERSHRMPLLSARALGLCDRFRTLEEHAQHIAGTLQLPPGQVPDIRQALDQLADEGLLRSDRDVYQMLPSDDKQPAAEQAIETLFVRTCARPETLERLLQSIGDSPDDCGGLKRCLVLDDDPDASRSQATADLVARYHHQSPIELHYISRSQRRKLLAAIARECGAPADDLIWCIEGSVDDERPGYGSSLNLALLLGAGERMAIIDDDAALSAFRLSGCTDTIRFSPQHQTRMAIPDPAQSLADQFEAVKDHPVTAHARYLGVSGGYLAAIQQDDPGALFSELDPQLLFNLTAATQVRMTSNGTLGDPGTSGIHWLFAEPGDHLKPFFESEERYRQLLEQRQIARSPGCIQASTAVSLMTTTLTGIDNRELLLPTQPRGANEDLLFGVLVSYLHPGSLHLALPHMLLHLRPQPRRWQADDLKRPRTTNQGRFMADQIERLGHQLPAGNIDSRLQVLTGWLGTLAELDPSELRWRLHQDLLELRADTVEKLATTRREIDPPSWLAADMDQSLAIHTDITSQDHTRLEKLAHHLPDFARRYAASMESWCRAWRYCREQSPGALLGLHRPDSPE